MTVDTKKKDHNLACGLSLTTSGIVQFVEIKIVAPLTTLPIIHEVERFYNVFFDSKRVNGLLKRFFTLVCCWSVVARDQANELRYPPFPGVWPFAFFQKEPK